VNTKLKTGLVAAASAALLGATAMASAAEYANVVSATPVTNSVAVPRQDCVQGEQVVQPPPSGAGAVIGAIAGGVIGNQFGHGLGRAAMTGVGAAGGAIAGNNVERNYKTAVVGYRVHVRLDNGSTRTFERKDIGNLHVGDRIRLDANGFRRA
jgi:uncharacterized protein YcfJ